jgi:hypothetical protein
MKEDVHSPTDLYPLHPPPARTVKPIDKGEEGSYSQVSQYMAKEVLLARQNKS